MKEKQIEEMARELLNACAWRFGRPNDYKELFNDIAEYLAEQGYRKLPKDSVVLSRDEYEEKYEPSEKFMSVARELEDLKQNLEDKVVLSREEYELLVACSSYEGVMKALKNEYKKGSKETAEKILNEVNEFFRPFDKKSPIFLDLLLTKLETVVKKYGVGIKGELR